MKLSDFISDKNGDGDEFRLAGCIIIAIGVIYGVVKGILGSPDWAGFSVLTGFGSLLFGGGLLGDKVKPTSPTAPTDSTRGAPQ